MKIPFVVIIVLVLSLSFITSSPYPTKDSPPYPRRDSQPYPTKENPYPTREENEDGSPYPTKKDSSQETSNNSNPLTDIFKPIENFLKNLFRDTFFQIN